MAVPGSSKSANYNNLTTFFEFEWLVGLLSSDVIGQINTLTKARYQW